MTIASSTSTTSATQLSGLASGLDTSSIIAKLMANATLPQTLLNNQITSEQRTMSALQTLNSQFASLATATAPLTGSYTANAMAATVSDPSVASASATSTAAAGNLSFSVDRLAARQSDVTAAMSIWTASTGLAITTSTGTINVTAASTSLDDVAAAINGAGAGVTATKVQAGTDGSGNPLYRLQLQSTSTGASSAYSITAGGQDIIAGLGGTNLTQAADAQITLWAGTSAAQAVTSSTNTFATVLPGVTLAVKGLSSGAISLDVSQDTQADASTVQGLVTSVQNILALVQQGSSASTSTDPTSGATTTNLGPFTTDSTVRTAAQDLTDALTLDANGTSLSSIGINLDENGNITFDSSTFQTAMTNDPAGTQSLLATVTSRVSQVATNVSDPTAGSLSTEISGEKDTIAAMQQKSTDMATLLTQKQTQLEQQFSYMETMISQINSQGSFLTSYFDSLNGTSSSSTKKSS